MNWPTTLVPEAADEFAFDRPVAPPTRLFHPSTRPCTIRVWGSRRSLRRRLPTPSALRQSSTDPAHAAAPHMDSAARPGSAAAHGWATHGPASGVGVGFPPT